VGKQEGLFFASRGGGIVPASRREGRGGRSLRRGLREQRGFPEVQYAEGACFETREERVSGNMVRRRKGSRGGYACRKKPAGFQKKPWSIKERRDVIV